MMTVGWIKNQRRILINHNWLTIIRFANSRHKRTTVILVRFDVNALTHAKYIARIQLAKVMTLYLFAVQYNFHISSNKGLGVII